MTSVLQKNSSGLSGRAASPWHIYHRVDGDVDSVNAIRAARDALNWIAAAPAAVPELSQRGLVELKGSVSELLYCLARDALRLLGALQAVQIRQCQAQVCTIFFVDESRSGDRRCCSMSACGNKAKVADFPTAQARRRARGLTRGVSRYWREEHAAAVVRRRKPYANCAFGRHKPAFSRFDDGGLK